MCEEEYFLFCPWRLRETSSYLHRFDRSGDIDFLRGGFESLAVSVVLVLMALARGVLPSRGIESSRLWLLRTTLSPSIHPFSSSGLLYYFYLFGVLIDLLFSGCALCCVLTGSVPPVQLLILRLTSLQFLKKASDEECKLFLVGGSHTLQWIMQLDDTSQYRVLMPMVVLLSFSLAGFGAFRFTSGHHPIPDFLHVWFQASVPCVRLVESIGTIGGCAAGVGEIFTGVYSNPFIYSS